MLFARAGGHHHAAGAQLGQPLVVHEGYPVVGEVTHRRCREAKVDPFEGFDRLHELGESFLTAVLISTLVAERAAGVRIGVHQHHLGARLGGGGRGGRDRPDLRRSPTRRRRRIPWGCAGGPDPAGIDPSPAILRICFS